MRFIGALGMEMDTGHVANALRRMNVQPVKTPKLTLNKSALIWAKIIFYFLLKTLAISTKSLDFKDAPPINPPSISG